MDRFVGNGFRCVVSLHSFRGSFRKKRRADELGAFVGQVRLSLRAYAGMLTFPSALEAILSAPGLSTARAMGKKPQHPSTSMFDKLVDQTAAWALAAVLSTALLGGSTYLLLQLPDDQTALERTTTNFQKFYRRCSWLSILEWCH